ncbi:polysaccharide deacetylase family protein [Streptosporangium amethystogenes subsp. fukuiense]|uniref:Polysaccharide deacetylase family protein n=2 Tax=Streptosporangium TaxID=2000 RepID=A0ABW2TEC2_9ACTN
MRVRMVSMALLLAAAGCASPITTTGAPPPTATIAPTGRATPIGPNEPTAPIVPIVPAGPTGPPGRTAPAGAPAGAPAAGAPSATASGTAGARKAEARPDWPVGDFPVPRPARRINCERVRCVALTFDDGPGAYTAALLDMLARHRGRATFFVVGQMVPGDGERILRRMVAEGHELGNHSWSHPELPGLSEAGIREQLNRTQWIVKRATGVTMDLMRPPYGATDARVAAESRHLGLAQILWDVDTLDWRDRDSSIVARRAAEATPGSIVLMHDIHASTVQAVPRLLHHFAARGYRLVTLSELYGRRLVSGRKYPVDSGF